MAGVWPCQPGSLGSAAHGDEDIELTVSQKQCWWDVQPDTKDQEPPTGGKRRVGQRRPHCSPALALGVAWWQPRMQAGDAFSHLHKGREAGQQVTHIPAWANPKSYLWSLQLIKSPILWVKLTLSATSSSCPQGPKKGRDGGQAAPRCAQHSLPAMGQSSCPSFILQRKPWSDH